MRFLVGVAVALLVAYLPAQPAHAYLDSGTGSLVIQGAIAAAGAVVVSIRIYWSRIKAWLRAGSRRSKDSSSIRDSGQ